MDTHKVWADRTFGNTPPTAPLYHLSKEVDEVIGAIEQGFDPAEVKEEFADCFILLMNAVSKYGMKAEELFDEVDKKFAKAQKRKWGPLDKNGVSHHIED